MLNNHPIAIYTHISHRNIVPSHHNIVPLHRNIDPLHRNICIDETASNLQNFIAICNSVDWCGLVIYDLKITLRNAFSIFLAIGMLCIYLTLNHHRNISPQYSCATI